MLTLTVAVLAITACAGRSTPSREPNCVVPPDENGLLADYAGDPAVAFVPDGTSRTGPIGRQHGCLHPNISANEEPTVIVLVVEAAPQRRNCRDPARS